MNKDIIKNIFQKSFDKKPINIKRLLTGNCHYVYRVDLDFKRKYIIRISTPENAKYLSGSIYWLEKLKSFNIVIPKIIVNGLQNEIPFVILNYIQGNDLGEIYNGLTEEQKKVIVKDLIQIQGKIETLPEAKGYGYLFSYEDKDYKLSWKEVIKEHLTRSKERIKLNGNFDYKLVEKVEKLLVNFEHYFDSIRPTPFLDDITTKNVLIHNGELSGIIDLDCMCFGDKLYVVALTNMALLSLGLDTNYVKYWAKGLNLNEEQKNILNLYTLIFCLDFMGEKGMKFNKNEPIPVSKHEIKLLNATYKTLINNLRFED